MCGEIAGTTFTQSQCDPGHPGAIDMMHLARPGADAQCGECTICGENEWFSQTCTPEHDSQCTACSDCDGGRAIGKGGQRIASDAESDGVADGNNGSCKMGSTIETGSDTICVDCANLPEPGYWEQQTCLPTDVEETPIFAQCTTCPQGTWTQTDCEWNADTVCPQCTPVNHCHPDMQRCSNANDTMCCSPGEYGPQCCSEEFAGEECCYFHLYTDCGSGPGFKQYQGRKMGYDSSGVANFIDWCQMMCDETEDCYAYEVTDDGVNKKETGPKDFEGAQAAKEICILHDTFSFISGNCHYTGASYPDFTNAQDCKADGHSWGRMHTQPPATASLSRENACTAEGGTFDTVDSVCMLCFDEGESFPYITTEEECLNNCPQHVVDGNKQCQWDEKDDNDSTYGLPSRSHSNPAQDCYVNVCRQPERRIRDMTAADPDYKIYEPYTPHEYDIRMAHHQANTNNANKYTWMFEEE